ncbi:Prp11 protein [Martiniozyma asiatica (nom. inval.)]|nr:Prp11 protein [Martiniozyma asiatica]
MDYQNRVGSKKGSGGVADSSIANQHRQERLKSLLLTTANLDNDPHIFRNNLGALECKLCLTTHMNETSYLTHKGGRRHVMNLMRRSEIEKKSKPAAMATIEKHTWEGIGKPNGRVVKLKEGNSKGLRIEIELPNIKKDTKPMHRLMSCFEQKVELVDTNFQYLVISAEPYDIIGYKIPGNAINLETMWEFWDEEAKVYYVQLFYLAEISTPSNEAQV